MQNSLRRNWMLRQHLFFWSGCLSIQFFNLPLPLTQSVRPPMATYSSLCSTCVTYGMPCHARGHQVLLHPPCHPSLSRGLSPVFYTHFILSAQPSTEWFTTYPTTLFLPREAEDFPRVDKHFKHVPPPTYLIYLPPKDLYS